MHQQRKVLHREILEKDDRIRKLESVVSELSTENLLLKKALGTSHRDPRCAGNGGRGHKDCDTVEGAGRISHQEIPCRLESSSQDLLPLDQPFGQAAPSGGRCAQGKLDPAGGARKDPGLQAQKSDGRRRPAGLHDTGPGGCGRLFHSSLLQGGIFHFLLRGDFTLPTDNRPSFVRRPGRPDRCKPEKCHFR